MECTQILSIASLAMFRASSRYSRSVAWRSIDWSDRKAIDAYTKLADDDDRQAQLLFRLVRPNFGGGHASRIHIES